MLRITVSGYVKVRTLELDGKLVGPWVDELRTAIRSAGGGESVCLNLQHLAFADTAGLGLLRELRGEGVQLVGALPLMEGLLAQRVNG